jgi:phosphoribosylglycinamide formyltransferase-1
MPVKIAIFASGSGSNAENIIQHFHHNEMVDISLILSNKVDAFVHERAKKFNISSFSFTKTEWLETDKVLHLLEENNINFIVLAGFLLKIPSNLLKKYPDKIINIHPALLPKYGGKGMYGHHVHEAVVANHEKESGITIHYINEHYDEGNIIFQASCPVSVNDTPDDVAAKIHELEGKYFPSIIETVLKEKFTI